MVRKHASLVNDEEINGAAWAAARGGTIDACNTLQHVKLTKLNSRSGSSQSMPDYTHLRLEIANNSQWFFRLFADNSCAVGVVFRGCSRLRHGL